MQHNRARSTRWHVGKRWRIQHSKSMLFSIQVLTTSLRVAVAACLSCRAAHLPRSGQVVHFRLEAPYCCFAQILQAMLSIALIPADGSCTSPLDLSLVLEAGAAATAASKVCAEAVTRVLSGQQLKGAPCLFSLRLAHHSKQKKMELPFSISEAQLELGQMW